VPPKVAQKGGKINSGYLAGFDCLKNTKLQFPCPIEKWVWVCEKKVAGMVKAGGTDEMIV
jgi:hypothetical protein